MSAAEFMEKAQATAAELDPAFLWEVAPDEEFGYEAIAADYFTAPKPFERAAVLLALHGNPVYFYRKGRGNYRKAPADILERALAAVKSARNGKAARSDDAGTRRRQSARGNCRKSLRSSD